MVQSIIRSNISKFQVDSKTEKILLNFDREFSIFFNFSFLTFFEHVTGR